MVEAEVEDLGAAEAMSSRCFGTFNNVFGTFALVILGVFEIDDERFAILADDDVTFSKVAVLNTAFVQLQEIVNNVQPVLKVQAIRRGNNQ